MFKLDTRILILDDMMTMRKIVAKTLKEIGFTDIQQAIDGAQGWEMLNASNPPIQLIISDWNMPNMSGIDLLKKVKADERFKKIPFVLLTAETEASQVMEALKSGAANYIIKPFTPDILRNKLEQTHKKVAA